MNSLVLPRTLANALLGDLQSGAGQGLVGALQERPCSVYPVSAEQRGMALDLLTRRGETLMPAMRRLLRNLTTLCPKSP